MNMMEWKTDKNNELTHKWTDDRSNQSFGQSVTNPPTRPVHQSSPSFKKLT